MWFSTHRYNTLSKVCRSILPTFSQVSGLRFLRTSMKCAWVMPWGPDSIKPIGDGCGDEGCAEVVPGELVVSGCDTTPIFEPAPQAFDAVSLLVSPFVVGDGPSPGLGRGDDRLGLAALDQLAQVVGVVAAVGDQAAEGADGADQIGGNGDVVDVACREQKDSGSPLGVGQAMELRRAPAARAADGLCEVPPFAPAAERWALTCVLSMATVP